MSTDVSTNGLIDSPYGITYYVDPHNGSPLLLDPNLVSDLVQMAGQGVWLRYQLEWLSIETSYTIGTGGKFLPVYDWHVLDDAVSQCNKAGVNICWNIQSPPLWRQSVDPSTGKVLPGNGTTCNTTLTSAITAGTTPSPAPDGNAVISVVALGTGQSLTTGQIVGLGLGAKTQKPTEQVLAAANYGAGTTQIKVTDLNGNIWVPQNSFAGPTQKAPGAAVTNSGGVLENATDTAQFAYDVASRYNNNAGHGLIQAIQIGNEEFDSYGPRDIQSQWLVPVANAAAPMIRAVHPSCRIGVCSVRRTAKKSVQHIQNWLTGLYTYQGGITTKYIDWLDYHYYRDGATAGPDPSTEDGDTPSVSTEVKTIRQVAAQYGHSPQIWCGETGWNGYDDGTGQLTTLQIAVTTGGGPYTQVTIPGFGLTNAANIWSQIYLDYGNTNQELVFMNANWQKGSNNIGISSVSGQNTNWTPASNHSAGCPVYIPAGNSDTLAQYAKYLKSMYDGMRQNGGAKVLIFTMDRRSTVLPYSNIQAGAGPNAVYSTVQKGITQTIGSTYTYLAPYTMTQAYAQQYPLWTGASGGTSTQVLSSRFNLQAARLRKLAGRFNLRFNTTLRTQALASRYRLSSLPTLALSARFLLQGATTRKNRQLPSRYRLASQLTTLFIAARVKLLPGGLTAPSPDSLPSFFAPPVLPVRFGIGTYQPLYGSATTTIDGGFPNSPGTPHHPYAGLYGGTYGFLLDTTIKPPQETQYTPAAEIGLNASGVSVVRGFPQITWTYSTMRPDYWYYLQQLYRQSAKAPPGFQYMVLLQYPSGDGTNTAIQVLARMNPPTFSYRTVGAFFSVSLLFTYLNQATLIPGTPIQILVPT